ncbi:TPA: hypothetical protein MI676_20555 [Klebsiella pneumoniae]|nr:hypothetical protein [Klebsiella pneumoniae]
MDNRFSPSIICNYYEKSYLCIRVTITGSQKSYFSISTVARSGFTGGGTHTVWGLRQRLLVVLTRKLLFADDMSTKKKIKKKMQRPLLVQKNLFGFL